MRGLLAFRGLADGILPRARSFKDQCPFKGMFLQRPTSSQEINALLNSDSSHEAVTKEARFGGLPAVWKAKKVEIR